MSESKTPTPRTDAEAKRQENWAEEVRADTYDCWMETFRFARSLELELNETKRKLRAIELVRGTHDCGCEVCGMGSAVCPASASSYALAIVEAKDQLTTAQQEIAELKRERDDAIESTVRKCAEVASQHPVGVSIKDWSDYCRGRNDAAKAILSLITQKEKNV